MKLGKIMFVPNSYAFSLYIQCVIKLLFVLYILDYLNILGRINTVDKNILFGDCNKIKHKIIYVSNHLKYCHKWPVFALGYCSGKPKTSTIKCNSVP